MKTTIITLSLIAVISTFMAIAGNKKHSLQTEIIIYSPAEVVYAALMDFENYGQWNPFIKEISGNAKVGDKLKVVLQTDEESTMVFKPEVQIVAKDSAFQWEGKLLIKGIFDGQHYFTLERIDDNSVKLVHGENFTGILSGLFMKMIGDNTHKNFTAMNEALKEYTESNQQLSQR